MNRIFIRLCGTVLAIWNFLMPSAHGYEHNPKRYTSYCENQDDVLVLVPYKDLPEHSTPAYSGSGSGTVFEGYNPGCNDISCTLGCNIEPSTYDPPYAFFPVIKKYNANGRIGFCIDSGIWMPYGHVKSFKDVSNYISGTGESGYRNTQQWPNSNEIEVIGTSPCVDPDRHISTVSRTVYIGCIAGYYGAYLINLTTGDYECTKCPNANYGTYTEVSYSNYGLPSCTGVTCCFIDGTGKDKTGTFTVSKCRYQE